MSFKFISAVILSLFISQLTQADEMGPQGDKFYEEAGHFFSACSESPCKAPYSAIILFNQQSRLNKLSAAQKEGLQKVAWEQAQIWGDTILEGDYVSAGRTRLDLVTGYYKENVLVGYKIQYSEKAWYTGECDYDGTQAKLKGCPLGRIAESSFVSADLRTFFTVEEKQANFEALDKAP